MNTPDTPKKLNSDKRMMIAIVVAIVAGRIPDALMPAEPWWSRHLVSAVVAGVAALLTMWILGGLRRN